MTIIRSRLPLLLGALEALLICRLIALLLAANPANPFVAVLLALSAPLAAPMSWVDSGQPIFGSRFERGALLMLIVIAVLGYGLWLLAGRPVEKQAYDYSSCRG